MIDRDYSFIINETTEVFFTQESRINFFDMETEEEIFSIDPTDLAVVLTVYNCIMALWAKYDVEDERMLVD